MKKNTRIEKDFLGEKELSNDCYYGVQTLRAKENFQISGMELGHYPTFVVALAQVKKACAMANFKLGNLPKDIKEAIVKACDEIIDRKFIDQFVVDPIQGGAGTSSNMNANEVIANIALEFMGHPKGSYDIINPNNHVNMSQSTNDVYPSAIKVALYNKITWLENSVEILKESFNKKSIEFKNIVKIGRTQLQDAVPMTLGQEFKTYETILRYDLKTLKRMKSNMTSINLGGTAIGTGINADDAFKMLVEKYLQKITGAPFVCADDLIEATQDTSPLVALSSVLKRIAIKTSKICNDLRLLSSGPRAGFNEINLPPMQAGSSIMPGKVNPVIPEVVNQVAFQIIGTDITISMASEAGQLQLNAFEPIIAHNLFQSTTMLSRALETLATKCIDGITANKEQCDKYANNSISLITAVSPIIGYQKSSLVAKRALKEGKSIHEILLEEKLFSKEEITELLDPLKMV